ncbi:cytochrome c oxidase assembly protein subunit 15 [Seinonella peptonophila]|uniref:Cytochrome c oxidase assembly protein subunit 15 n=1 Tax=Seinonella peptonophila TaxID=112248 RepID=A0A1M4TJA9_9BACL|nr:heme A synthase [Seinonella peptonophila]SHE44573.1 cytochrome c oxidase assembly protein subunit 15 [Seinonella peptonophila]
MLDRLLRYLSVVTAFGAYLMLLMGAIVTKTGSGKGCGNSWPFCHGQLIPQSLPIETVFEYSHRIISGSVGFLILVLTVATWIRYRSDRKVKTLGFLSLFFVILQGALGALTVVFEDTFAKQAALALHFGFSLISFASVVLLAVHLFQMNKADEKTRLPVHRGLQVGVWGLAIYTYLVVYTGAYVRHAHATMGCGYQFPGCGSHWLPNFVTPSGIHMLHRFAAISLVLFVLIVAIWIWNQYRQRKDLVHGVNAAFVFIILQAASGVITVFTGGQVLAALLHTTLISIFFAILCYLCMQVLNRKSIT